MVKETLSDKIMYAREKHWDDVIKVKDVRGFFSKFDNLLRQKRRWTREELRYWILLEADPNIRNNFFISSDSPVGFVPSLNSSRSSMQAPGSSDFDMIFPIDSSHLLMMRVPSRSLEYIPKLLVGSNEVLELNKAVMWNALSWIFAKTSEVLDLVLAERIFPDENT